MDIKLTSVRQVQIRRIKKNAKNPGIFPQLDGELIYNLKEDIKKRGIIVPLIAKKDGTLLAGHSRLYVAQQLKLKTVPVQFVEQKLTAKQEEDFMIRDNVLRRQLSPEDRKALYKRIYKDFDERLMLRKHKDQGIDIKTIAEKTGLRPNTVSYDINMMRHKAAREQAATRKIDPVDVKAIAQFKKSCAKMLNAAVIGGKSTLSELAEILKTTQERFKTITEMNDRRGA